jgi:hypothetical protein
MKMSWETYRLLNDLAEDKIQELIKENLLLEEDPFDLNREARKQEIARLKQVRIELINLKNGGFVENGN